MSMVVGEQGGRGEKGRACHGLLCAWHCTHRKAKPRDALVPGYQKSSVKLELGPSLQSCPSLPIQGLAACLWRELQLHKSFLNQGA